MKKLSSNYSPTIDYVKLNADLLEGNDLAKKAEKLFDLAIQKVNRGMIFKSVEIAKEALVYAKYSNSYIRVYIHSFLAMMSLDIQKIDMARIHCWHAISLLDEKKENYRSDKAYLEELNRQIHLSSRKRIGRPNVTKLAC